MSLLILRLQNRGLFGAAVDGTMGHIWYSQLDNVILGHTALAAGTKVLADSLLWSPMYCAVYLKVMALLEGHSAGAAAARIQKDWHSMVTATISAWLPANVLIYGVVPLEYRCVQ